MTAPIVIVGGYGLVGRLLAERLAPQHPGRVVIAGRDSTRAAKTAATLGHGARAVRLDAADPESVRHLVTTERPELVLACAPKTEKALVGGCVDAGVHYADVSADGAGIEAVEKLDPFAAHTGATVVLSVGIAPGVTNLLAAQVCSSFDEVERLDLGVRLGIADEHGAAALDWTLENLAVPFSVVHNGEIRPQRPFVARRHLDFGDGHRSVAAAFNFPEQRSLARTLDIPTVRSWLTLEPRAVHLAAVVAARSGTARVFGSAKVRSPAVTAMGAGPHQQGRFAVCAEASGVRDGQSQSVAAWFAGTGEAAMTAEVAAGVATRLLDGDQPPGVRHIEQLPGWRGILSAVRSDAPSGATGSRTG